MMSTDKQLQSISLDKVLRKRTLDQALNAKEFAVLAGISYSAARTWFKLPGFPVVRGFVFWHDFVRWRKAIAGLHSANENASIDSEGPATTGNKTTQNFTGRAAKILSEAG